jgi:hypothetical protein
VNRHHEEVGTCRVGLEVFMVAINGHMEKMNLEDLVEVGSNDEVVVETCDMKVVVSYHLEIAVVVVGA